MSYLCSDPPCLTAWYDGAWQPLTGVTDTVATGLCPGSTSWRSPRDGMPEHRHRHRRLSARAGAQPQQLSVTAPGECDGSATVGTHRGWGPYTFDWTPDPPNGTAPAGPGTLSRVYTVLIADALGCDSLVSVLIAEARTPSPQPQWNR